MLNDLFTSILAALLSFTIYLLAGALIFLFFFLVGRLLAWGVLRFAQYRARMRGRQLSAQRIATLHGLAHSLMNGMAALLTLIFILGQFIPAGSVATTLGLFSAGIGFAARPFLSDVLGGIVLLLKDQFALGEKVEIGDRIVIGVVERVGLTSTQLRGDAGELWIVPNGDVRTIRNFSRGSFSPANLRLTLPTSRLAEAIEILQEIIADPGRDVIEPPEIISEAGEIGQTTTLTLKVRARHGAAQQVRRRLLARLQHELDERQIISRAHPADGHGEPDVGAIHEDARV